jgi:hypothetical protein
MTVTMKAALVLFALGSGALGASSFAVAEMAVTDVAYVESLNGRAIALVQGKPTLLEPLDIIDERTRVDILANSEVRLCHYRNEKLLILRGPLRVSVSASAVTAEGGQEISGFGERCVKPAVSTFQGGFLARSAATALTRVALQPRIKIVNRGAKPIRSVALWDSEQRRIVATFERGTASPTLDEGQAYVLVVGRSDGSQLKMKLVASAITETGPLILVVR